MGVVLLVLVGLLAALPSTGGAQAPTDIYVAPGASGSGALGDPASLRDTLESRSIPPGTTIWLRGGTYEGTFRSRSDGTEADPIVVRPYPGEHAVLDRNAATGDVMLQIDGDWQVWRDLEFTNSNESRWLVRPLGRPTLIDVHGWGTALINNDIHDGGVCVGWWKASGESLLYGNLIYDCGWDSSDRGHGHAVYIQNEDGGRKTFRHNVIGSTYGRTMLIAGSDQVHDLDIIENTMAGGHSLAEEVRSPVYIAGNIRDMRFNRNHVYTLTKEALSILEGAGDVRFNDNYFMTQGDALAAIWVRGGQPASGTGNHIATDRNQIRREPGAGLSGWDDNRYYGPDAFYPSGDLAAWRADTGQDANSVVVSGNPTHVAVHPNRYDGDRGTVTVWNGARSSQVRVDVSSILEPGDTFRVLWGQDLGGEPIMSGTYDGGRLAFPMTDRPVGAPIGGTAPPPWNREFGVYVILGGEPGDPPEQPDPRPDNETQPQTPTCRGRVATIVATPGMTTVGTAGADVIVGTSGPDTIFGGGGDDVICGRGGPDVISGNAGDDVIDPGRGADEVSGGSGSDWILASAGDDRLEGQRGQDRVDGGSGADIVKGGSGADDLTGGKGADHIRGGKGADQIDGRSGQDDCKGGRGSDTKVSCET